MCCSAPPRRSRRSPQDLWDLIGILHQGRGNFVLGNDFAAWHRAGDVLDILVGPDRR